MGHVRVVFVERFSTAMRSGVINQVDDIPYSIPFSSRSAVPSLLVSHHGATLPFGGMPLLNSVSRL